MSDASRAASFGEKVRIERERKGWSQEKLAQEAGVSQTTIDKIERLVTRRSRYGNEIAAALGIKATDLLPANFTFEVTPDGSRAAQEYREANRKIVPMFSTFENDRGILVFSKEALTKIEASSNALFLANSFAFQLSSSRMAPEFETGDLIFVERELRPVTGLAHLFTPDNVNPTEGVLGRLLHYDDTHWTIARWSHGLTVETALTENVPRSEYPTHHRVLARHPKG